MRLIDADAIIPRIKLIIEAERQIFKKTSWNFAEKCLTVVESAPTVSAEPDWIPCSERLPEEKDAGGILKKLGTSKRSDYVLATVEVKNESMTVTACTYDGVWDWKMKYAFPDYKVLAWMPLPKPYMGGKKE